VGSGAAQLATDQRGISQHLGSIGGLKHGPRGWEAFSLRGGHCAMARCVRLHRRLLRSARALACADSYHAGACMETGCSCDGVGGF
jgi:hypothetical protein